MIPRSENRILQLLVVAAVALFSSCKKDLDADPAQSSTTTDGAQDFASGDSRISGEPWVTVKDSIRAFTGPADNDSVLAILPIGTVVRGVSRSADRNSGTGGSAGHFWYHATLPWGQSAWIYGAALYEMGAATFLASNFHGEIKMKGKDFRVGVASEEDLNVGKGRPDVRHGIPFIVEDSNDKVRFLFSDSIQTFGVKRSRLPSQVRLVNRGKERVTIYNVKLRPKPNNDVVQFDGIEEFKDGGGDFQILAKHTADSFLVTSFTYTPSDPNP